MVYVMSDIHGNLPAYRSIMKQIKLKPEDKLYVLGDIIDRYPDGIRILRELMQKPNVHMLLGNHEYMMLQALVHNNERMLRIWYRNGGISTHNSIKHTRKDVRQEIFNYLTSLPINIDIEVNGIKYKLIHGSPLENYYRERRFWKTPEEFAVWERWNECDPVPEGYILIFGHTPTINLNNISPMIVWKSDEAIGIDCGSGYAKEPEFYDFVGRLACIRLDDMQVFYSDAKNTRMEG